MYLLKKSFLMIALTTLLSAPLFAQDSLSCHQGHFQDSLLDKLTGQCNLTGVIGKRPVRNNFSGTWVLDHQFLELNFTDTVDSPGYRAKVLIGYDCISDQYIVHWLDSFGGAVFKNPGYWVP